ncbi:MAG: AbrB/MazE/SpoVT family DNA-binding domain-containing protein [Cyanobacteriota bacterium]
MEHLEPILQRTIANTGSCPTTFIADAGYWSEENAEICVEVQTDPHIATGHQKHRERGGHDHGLEQVASAALKATTRRRVMSLQVAVKGRRRSVTQSRPQDCSADAGQHFPQAIRRWGNSLAVRLPADGLRQAGLQEGDQIDIVVGSDGRLSLEPLCKLDRSALATDLRQLQVTIPLTPSVIEECRGGERW